MKLSVEIKISLLMFLAVAIVIATGFLSYKSISSIVNSIETKVKPDLKLEHIRDIATRLEKAENGIRAYLLTNNKKSLRPYFRTLTQMNSIIDSLKFSTKNDIKLHAQLDTLNFLIDEKMAVWREMLLLSNDEEIKAQYLEIEKVLNPQVITDTLISYKKTKVVKDSVQQPKIEEKKGFFQRLFGKNEIEIKNEPPDNYSEAEWEYDVVEVPVFIEKPEEIDQQKVKEEINKLKELDIQKQLEIKERDFKLAQTSIIITERLYQLIEKIEKDEGIKNREKIKKAGNLANATYKWLAWFSISGTLLAIIVIITLSSYTRKTRAYQIALEQSKTEAEKLIKTRELFIANVSHEIRTPLNAISGFTSNLLKKQSATDISRDLNIIKSASGQLLRMIDDVLDFSRLQAEKLKLEYSYFSLKDVFEELYNLFLHRAVEQKIAFYYTIDDKTHDVLYGDPYRLKQILINLINNSLKFTKEGNVTFCAEIHKLYKGTVELKITVKDTGIGIEKDKLPLVFDEFVQEDPGFSRKYGGTGLGLAIVKKIVELHKGRIEIESKKNSGTAIIVFISYKIGDERKIIRQVPKKISVTDSLQDKRILVVDDNEYNRLLLKKLLENIQILVEEATCGNEAIEFTGKNKYDIILMDIRMPDINGFKVTRFIRESLNHPNALTPIIAISAAVNDEFTEKAKKAGINSIILKPFNEDELFESIAANLSIDNFNTVSVKSEPLKNKSERFNIEAINRVSGNQQKFVNEMLDKFNEMMENSLIEIYQEYKNGNMNLVKEIAHKIAPPCQHIGAYRLKNILKEIENYPKDIDNRNQVYNFIKDAESEFILVKGEINSFLSHSST